MAQHGRKLHERLSHGGSRESDLTVVDSKSKRTDGAEYGRDENTPREAIARRHAQDVDGAGNARLKG